MVFVGRRVTANVFPGTIDADGCEGRSINNALTVSVTALPMRPRGQLFWKTRRLLH